MSPHRVAEIRQRLRAIPWQEPIRVPFACDERPLFGCRLCILTFGLRRGECTHLFADEAEAWAHTTGHAGALSAAPDATETHERAYAAMSVTMQNDGTFSGG